MKHTGKRTPPVQENITTQGDFSPGKVGQNYTIGDSQTSATELHAADVPQLSSQDTPKTKENISTEGHYSPGKVGGSYTVKMEAEGSTDRRDSVEPVEVNEQLDPKVSPDKHIRTKGNYSPGEVGGDYKVEG